MILTWFFLVNTIVLLSISGAIALHFAEYPGKLTWGKGLTWAVVALTGLASAWLLILCLQVG